MICHPFQDLLGWPQQSQTAEADLTTRAARKMAAPAMRGRLSFQDRCRRLPPEQSLRVAWLPASPVLTIEEEVEPPQQLQWRDLDLLAQLGAVLEWAGDPVTTAGLVVTEYGEAGP